MTIGVFKQKEIAREAVRILEETFMKSTGNKLEDYFAYKDAMVVVAGGMVRDHYFGNPAKDIDVFIREKDLPEDEELRDQFILSAFIDAKWKIHKMTIEEDSPEYAHQIVDVYEFESPEGQLGNVVIAPTMEWEMLIARFPANLSKCYKVGDNSVFHEDFVHGVSTKTLEFQQFLTSEAYFEKIKAKFPHYKTRIL